MVEETGFAQRLKELRKKAGMSQEGLAEAIGISVMTVRRWEWGERTPRMDEIKNLSSIFGLSESELLNGVSPNVWELRLVMNKTGKTCEEVKVDMTSQTSSAVLNVSDDAMAITLSAGYQLWEDDRQFEELIEQLRKKRAAGLKMRREDW